MKMPRLIFGVALGLSLVAAGRAEDFDTSAAQDVVKSMRKAGSRIGKSVPPLLASIQPDGDFWSWGHESFLNISENANYKTFCLIDRAVNDNIANERLDDDDGVIAYGYLVLNRSNANVARKISGKCRFLLHQGQGRDNREAVVEFEAVLPPGYSGKYVAKLKLGTGLSAITKKEICAFQVWDIHKTDDKPRSLPPKTSKIIAAL